MNSSVGAYDELFARLSGVYESEDGAKSQRHFPTQEDWLEEDDLLKFYEGKEIVFPQEIYGNPESELTPFKLEAHFADDTHRHTHSHTHTPSHTQTHTGALLAAGLELENKQLSPYLKDTLFSPTVTRIDVVRWFRHALILTRLTLPSADDGDDVKDGESHVVVAGEEATRKRQRRGSERSEGSAESGGVEERGSEQGQHGHSKENAYHPTLPVLVQLAGGPCGLLSCLQAYLLLCLKDPNFLLFDPTAKHFPAGQTTLSSRMGVDEVESGTGKGEESGAGPLRELETAWALVEALSFVIAQAAPETEGALVVASFSAIDHTRVHLPVDSGTSTLSFHTDADTAAQLSWTDLWQAVDLYTIRFEYGSPLQNNEGGHEGGQAGRKFRSKKSAVKNLQKFLFRNLFELFCRPRHPGLLSILTSIALSRGPARIFNQDFDIESDRALITVYGHCTQSLVNLFLVGRASANLFDLDKCLGGTPVTNAGGIGDGSGVGLPTASGIAGQGNDPSLTFRGIPRRSMIGYLTEMECLKYLKVGHFLKHPFTPFFIAATGDHYTLVFTREPTRAAISKGDFRAERADQIFDALDADSAGLLPASELHNLFSRLGQPVTEAALSLCSAGNVILKTDFINFAINAETAGNLAPTKIDRNCLLTTNDEKAPPDTFYHIDTQTSVSHKARKLSANAKITLLPSQREGAAKSTGSELSNAMLQKLQDVIRTRYSSFALN